MIPSGILGIPIIEPAAPGDFVAAANREFYSQIQAAIDMLRCPTCGGLNYETTFFFFAAGTEKLIECRNCGSIHEERLDDKRGELLAFLHHYILQGAASEEL